MSDRCEGAPANQTLRVRLQRGEIVVELEGRADAVRAVLSALETEGYGRLPEFFSVCAPAPSVPPAPGIPSGPRPEPSPEPSPQPSPGSPLPESPLTPIPSPARSLRFVIDNLRVPQSRSDFGADLDGDGHADNQIGALVGAMASMNLDVQNLVDGAVAAFSSPMLLRIDTELAMLTADQRVDVTISPGIVIDADQRTFKMDMSRPPATLLCRLKSGRIQSQTPPLGGAVVTLPVTLELFGSGPVTLSLGAAQITFKLNDDGSSLVGGTLNGALSANDLVNQVGMEFAAGLSARVSADPLAATSKQLLDIFDRGGCTRPDGSQAQANDGVIDLCEVLENPIVKSLLSPDVQLYDSSGRFAPGSAGAKKDSFSVGFGFTAIAATF